MRLITLGGSAAGVGTGQGCTSYLVQSRETSMVLDLGPGTLLQLRKHIDYRTSTGIVISHLHADHILDLVALRFNLSYNPISAERPIPLHLPPDGIATLSRIADAFEGPGTGIDWFASVFDIAEYDPDGSVTVGAFACTFRPTVHYVPCWAIRVRAQGATTDLLYSADTGPSADLDDFGRGCQVLIAEAANDGSDASPFEERGHLTPEEAGGLATRIGAHTLVLTHLWEEHDTTEMVRRATTAFHGTVVQAIPGLELAWQS